VASAEDLEEIRDNLIAAIKTATASPKPNYSIDGQSVSWGTYLDSLWARLRDVETQIASTSPVEIVSRGTTGYDGPPYWP
jgi:hypothetical protein